MKPKILIVDDEPDILEFLKFNFEQKGYKVFTAKNGMKALEKIKKFLPDIVLLDIMMPKLNGIETATMIRKLSGLNDPAVLFLTAKSDESTELKSFQAGADDFISKPVRIKTLMARVEAILKRRKGHANFATLIETGPLIINRSDYQVQLNGKPLELPRMEFEILSLLASKPGKIFRRKEIYEKVWGKKIIVGERTLDVHIRKLRKKLGEKLIKTHKGIGYSLQTE